MKDIFNFKRQLDQMSKRGWDTIYVAIDVHDTIFPSDYGQDKKLEYAPHAKETLQYLSSSETFTLILYSSTHRSVLDQYQEKFKGDNIIFEYINENPECPSNVLSDFSDKFYFNVLLDDKAGFQMNHDWLHILNFLQSYNKI